MQVALVSLKSYCLKDNAISLLLTLYSVCLTSVHPARLNINVSDLLKYSQTQPGRDSYSSLYISNGTFEISLIVFISPAVKQGQLNTTFILTFSSLK